MLQRMMGAAVLLSVVASAHAGTTIYVDDDAPGDPGPGNPLVSDPLEDGSAAHPFDAIQEAIDLAVNGDLVSVATGTYTGVGNRAMNFGGREISVVGAAAPVTIDLEETPDGFIFNSGESAAARLEGLIIRDGATSVGGAALRCSGGSSPTIVQCDILSHLGSGEFGAAVLLTGGSDVRFEGCRLNDNEQDNNFADGDLRGAAVHAEGSDPVFIDCEFSGNSGDSPHEADGAAIYVANGSVDLADCQFVDNIAYGDSGGVRGAAIHAVASPVVAERCSFVGNQVMYGDSARGGAVFAIDAVVVFRDCLFDDNDASGFCSGRGGAIAVFGGAGSVIERCQFTNNRAIGDGGCGGSASASFGAVAISDAMIVDCEFSSNDALANSKFEAGRGGAAHIQNTFRRCIFRENRAAYGGALAGFAAGTIDNCLFLRNRALGHSKGEASGLGGAVYAILAGTVIVNSTFIDNVAVELNFGGLPSGGGVYSTEGVQIDNCILRDNTPDQMDGPTATYSNVEGITSGSGNIDADPGFVDPGTDDYRLAAGSSCIDAASSLVAHGDFDLDQNPRTVDDPGSPNSGAGDAPHPDMGAYEFQAGACHADLDGSGDVGFADLLLVLGDWGACPGCPADLNADDSVTLADLLIVLSAWGPC